jgi:UDP-glucose 4-epimerase
MPTVLVTGGAGFIGSHLCDRLLAEGNRVVAVDDLSSGRLANIAEARTYRDAFTFYSLDIRAEGFGEIVGRHAPDLVYHLAARAEATASYGPAVEADVGIMGLLSVLQVAAEGGAGKIVFASSAAVYGDQRTFPIKETAMAGARPLSPQAVSKRVAEDYLRFHRRARGLDFTSVILPTVYGPRQDQRLGVVAAFATSMLANERPVVFGEGDQTRDFLFVDDGVHLLALCADGGSGKTVNGGTGLETSTAGLFQLLAEITSFPGDPIRGPARPHSMARCALHCDLAGRELSWKPWTHLEDGLRETVAFLRGS